LRITRRFTKRGESPYRGVAFCRCGLSADAAGWLEAPEFWSAEAVSLLARRCAEPARIAARLKPVPEADVPEFLWRHAPDAEALANLPADRRCRGEADIRALIDRVAGGWAYQGWKAGYFDSADDARAFFDEVRWILLHRRAAPELSQWRYAGLYWAYGIDASVADGVLVDYRTGRVRRGDREAVPPSGAVINAVTADSTGEGGIWALWRSQARLAELGCPTGVDLSALATGDGEDLSAMLAPGDAANGRPRRLTLRADHLHAERFVQRNLRGAAAAAAGTVGHAIALRHAGALAETGGDGPAGHFAMAAAAQAALPVDLIESIVSLAGTADADRLLAALAEPRPGHPGADADVTVLAIDDATLETAVRPASRAKRLLDGMALGGWTAGAAGLQYSSTVERWHGCAEAGPARTAAGDGDFLFLDDVAAGRAVLNAAGFLGDDGTFDSDGFAHAARLLTVALDISLASATHATPRIARRTWDYRPLALSLTGLAPLLMACGIAYDSDVARATAAALTALLTGSGFAASATLADELGAFPGWARNEAAMRAVIARQAGTPIGDGVSIAGLAEAARAAWQAALAAGERSGYRNAQISAVSPARDESNLTGAAGAGIAPSDGPIRFEAIGGGGWRRGADPAIAAGLRALGYDIEATAVILRRLLGHGSIEHAPGVNHETLRRRGFDDATIAKIEAALGEVSDIRDAFGRATLGDGFCRRMLGLTQAELEDPGFDMLAALGFSDAAIEAANVHCCGAGTLEGAARLQPGHLEVFDGARRAGALGRRQVSPTAIVRMIGAVQPFLSGAVGQTVELPHEASVADFRDLLLLGWRLGLKTLTLRRAPADTIFPELARLAARRPIRVVADGTASRPAGPADRHSEPRVLSQALALAHTARGLAGDPTQERVIATGPDGAGGDARASRRGSPDPARSAASVPSSADVVVEQRQV